MSQAILDLTTNLLGLPISAGILANGLDDILIMHDAEDVIHPLSLRLYSLLIPDHEFVQTPALSLPLGTRKLVAATSIDEFVEHHGKDMLLIVANLIGLAATVRAIRQYLVHAVTGKPLRWYKTAHEDPSLDPSTELPDDAGRRVP